MKRTHNKGNAKPEAVPPPIPADKYLMEITSAVYGKSKSSGADMYTCYASPVEGEFKGRKVRFYVIFSPKIMGQTLHFLKTIGEPWQGPAGDESNVEVDEERWIKRRFNGLVDIEMFNGEPQNKIKKVLPLDEGQQQVVAEDCPF